jgi:superfamily I DNA/RNA helicase
LWWPGAGKAATLTTRILDLIFVDGVKPRGILAATFAMKAAAALRLRALSSDDEY